MALRVNNSIEDCFAIKSFGFIGEGKTILLITLRKTPYDITFKQQEENAPHNNIIILISLGGHLMINLLKGAII